MGSVSKLLLLLIKQKINGEISKQVQRSFHFSLPQIMCSCSAEQKITWVHIFIFYFPKLPIFIYDLPFTIAKQKAWQITIAKQIEHMLSDESK